MAAVGGAGSGPVEPTNTVSPDEFLCGICGQLLKDPATTPCGHHFCSDHLKAWIYTKRLTNPIVKCPVCREPIQQTPEKVVVDTELQGEIEAAKATKAAKAAAAARARTPPISPEDATALGYQLLVAIETEDVNKCLGLVGAGADLTVKDSLGDAALANACYYSLPDVAFAIIECPGVKIDARNNAGITPLMWASRSGLTHVVAALLSMGAGINAVDEGGLTALYFACAYSQSATALHLIEAGADVNPAKHNPLSHPAVNTPAMAAVKAALLARGTVVAVAPARRNSRRNGRTSRRNVRKTRKTRKTRKSRR